MNHCILVVRMLNSADLTTWTRYSITPLHGSVIILFHFKDDHGQLNFDLAKVTNPVTGSKVRPSFVCSVCSISLGMFVFIASCACFIFHHLHKLLVWQAILVALWFTKTDLVCLRWRLWLICKPSLAQCEIVEERATLESIICSSG